MVLLLSRVRWVHAKEVAGAQPFMPFFLELIDQDPDITLAGLRAALLAAYDVTASTSGIDALLRRHGYSYRKRPDRRRAPQARGTKGEA